jgi:predicted O-methyltransferase YrrM
MNNLVEYFDEAVAAYGHETERLRFLPENRYNREIFPTMGQYDWLSSQLLYCLIRHFRPARIIEVSTSSGYSSLFSALALKANQSGRLETFELTPSSAEAAHANFERYDVADIIRLWVGDARERAVDLLKERRQQTPVREILFLDSEHTEAFARSYLDLFLPDAAPDALFHMHDVVPPDAKLMVRPLEAMKSWSFRPKGWLHRRLRRFAPGLDLPHPRRWVTPVPLQQLTSEAEFAHRLAAQIPASQQAYLHTMIERYPQLEGHRYDRTSFWRCDAQGRPSEWNESWWTVCGPLQAAYHALSPQDEAGKEI